MGEGKVWNSPQVYQDSAGSGRLILRDGSTATVYPATQNDKESVREFFGRLSTESLYNRFFSYASPNNDLLNSICTGNPSQDFSLIVSRTVGGSSRIIAVGSYMSTGKKEAEVAMAVDDEFHGKGIGTHLLERLALLAVQNGFVKFWATTHAQNQPMQDIFRHSGFNPKIHRQDSSVHFDFSIIPTKESVTRSEMMDRIFTAASMRPFFKPSSIAVVGPPEIPEVSVTGSCMR